MQPSRPRLRFWPHPQSAPSQAVREALSKHATLGDAAQLWRSKTSPSSERKPPTDPRQAADDARSDAAYQSFLNAASAPDAQARLGEVLVSPFAASGDLDRAEMTADRASTAVAGQAGDVTITGGTLPTSTAIGAGGSLGGVDVTGIVSAGAKSKTAVGLLSVGPLGAGLAATLVSSDKIRPLSAPKAGSDGVVRQLARFSTKVMPVLDLNLSIVADAVGMGGRALLGFGRSATYEKYVTADELAVMMRRRSNPLRNLLETLDAVTGAGTVRAPTRRQLAAGLGSVDRLTLGESVTWQGNFVLYLGVSAGTFGVRTGLGLQAQGLTTYRLERAEDGLVHLAFQPVTVRGVRASAEARLLADIGVDYLSLASQVRQWSFDTSVPEARAALSEALLGRMPGAVIQHGLHSSTDALGALGALQQEQLPAGVVNVLASFERRRELTTSISSLRLPELLGGHSLGASWTRSHVSNGSVEGGSGSWSITHEQSRSIGLLTMGDERRSEAATLVSALSIGPRGERLVTPTSLETEVSIETSRASRFGRSRLARRLSEATGLQVAIGGSEPGAGYSVTIRRTTRLADLARSATMSDLGAAALALDKGLPAEAVLAVRDAVARAAVAPDEKRLARELTGLAAFGPDGLRSAAVLAPESDLKISVVSEGHDQLMRDFLKAETYLAGAVTTAHAKAATARLGGLQERIAAAIDAIGTDGAIGLVSATEAGDRVAFLRAVGDEALALRGHALTIMGDKPGPLGPGRIAHGARAPSKRQP